MSVITGNAQIDGENHWGWFVGRFITPEDDPRSTASLEVKWGTHSAGEARSQWSPPADTTTLSVLVSGRFLLKFLDREVLLSRPGDYALWLPNTAHTWLAEADSVILTVRWQEPKQEV